MHIQADQLHWLLTDIQTGKQLTNSRS